jgi:hypothetical protein
MLFGWFQSNASGMGKPDNPGPDKELPKPQPSRVDEAQRMIEKYVAALLKAAKPG